MNELDVGMLSRRYGAMVLRRCQRLLGSQEEAEDACQDVFVRLFERRERLNGAAGVFHGYAYGESIVGAESTPLAAYLLGLALVQITIGLSTRSLFHIAARRTPDMGSVTLRWAGGSAASASLI